MEDPIIHVRQAGDSPNSLAEKYITDYRKYHSSASLNTFRKRIQAVNNGSEYKSNKQLKPVTWGKWQGDGQNIFIPMDLPENEQKNTSEQENIQETSSEQNTNPSENTTKEEPKEENTQKSSGKPSKAGLYIVCNGAECMCNQSNEQAPNGILEVTTQNSLYVNDKDGLEKLVASTLDLLIPFKTKAKTFGTCKLQPLVVGYKPCIPNIVQWGKSYEAIQLPNGGTALIEESEGICSFGGKVTFVTHGQSQAVSQAEATATPPEIAEMLLDGLLNEEEISKLAAGEFGDEKGVEVESINTSDGKNLYHIKQPSITLKATQYTKKNPNPSDAEKKAINWVVYKKKKNNTYQELNTFTDSGDVFQFPYLREGSYAVEAYGKTKLFNVNSGTGGASKLITIKGQGLKSDLTLTVGTQDRTECKRIRPTETATISAYMLFPEVEALKPKDIIWEVISEGNMVSFSKVKEDTQITIPPQGNTSTKTLQVSAYCNGIETNTLSFKVGGNYVKAITGNKDKVCVINEGEPLKERHSLSLEVSNFAINPPTEDEKALVKWTYFEKEGKPDSNKVIATGIKTSQTIKHETELTYAAFVDSPASSGVTTHTVKAIRSKITKAYWSDKNGNRISKSGLGHQVYIHIETEALVGEKLQLKVWEHNVFFDEYIENAGTEIEITQNNGVIHQAFTLPQEPPGLTERYQYEFFFTIEKLAFKVENTQKHLLAKDQYILIPQGKPHYLDVNSNKKITSLKIYEQGNKLHTGIVKYGDTVTLKINTRNFIDQELEFEVWKEVSSGQDKNTEETIKIAIDKEGNGESAFTIPKDWEKEHPKWGAFIPFYFYLKEKESGTEFPRPYYVTNPNKTEEENKKSSYRIRALMLKVAKTLKLDEAIENINAVILGEELNNGSKGSCKGKYCIRLGAEGKLIQEINIRLAGFGGNVPTKKFTTQTITMIKQFQKDYMEIEPTGNICGDTLKAIDEFGEKYTFPFEEVKCKCGVCSGFGKGRKSEERQNSSIKEKYRKYEYPGIHRSLLWAYKASLFYLQKESSLNYQTNSVSSGYRCHDHSIYKSSGTTNHCGKALDIHYNYNNKRTKNNSKIEEIRSKIFNKYLGAKWDWNAEKNIFYLESTSKGASTWVHIDVREFNLEFLKDEFFVKTETELKGKKIVSLAREDGYNNTCTCLGNYASQQGASSNPNGKGERVNPKTLKTSDKGIEFIKDWESFKSKAYNDSEGYCTIGYGHLIAYDRCENITLPDEFKNGITETKAMELFKSRLVDIEKAVQRDITVNLYQYEFDALVSLLFNAGASFLNVGGANNGETKIKRNINAEKYSEGADEMSDVINGGTSGLVKRRKAEINMFKNNIYDSTH